MVNPRASTPTSDPASLQNDVGNPNQQAVDETAVFESSDSLGETRSDLASGRMLGVYRLENKLGEGGMGTVWRATHMMLDRVVAIKVLPKQLMADRDAIARFTKEMKATAKIEHPNIIRATDAGNCAGHHFLVMEYIDGVDLAKHVNAKGPLKISDACLVLARVAQALHASHEHGIVHRDVKPSNIVLSGKGQIKLLDLGLARFQTDSGNHDQLTKSGQILGTPSYMAPEQWDNVRAVDHKTDLYALGCTFYFVLTGHPPYRSSKHLSWVELMKAHILEPIPSLDFLGLAIPDDLMQLYRKLMSKSPGDRPASAREVAILLHQIGQRLKKSASTTTEQLSKDELNAASAETAGDTAGDGRAVKSTRMLAQPVVQSGQIADAQHESVTQIRRQKKASRNSNHRWGRKAAVWTAAGFAPIVVVLGILFSLKTQFGEVQIELSDPSANVQISVDGNDINVGGLDRPLSLKPGEHGLLVRGDDFETVTKKIVVRKNEREAVRIELKPLAIQPTGTSEETKPIASQGSPSESRFDRRVTGRYSGDWRLEGSQLVQYMDGPTTIMFGDTTWSDYDFSFETMTRGDEGIMAGGGVACFRIADLKNLHTFSIGSYQGEFIEAAKWLENQWRRDVDPIRLGCVTNRWYKVKVSVRASHIECYFDDQKVFDYENAELPLGAVGLRAWNPGVCYRNIRVLAPDQSILWEGLPQIRADESVTQPTLLESGDWKIEGDELVQSVAENAKIFFGSKDWKDFDLSFESKTDPTDVPTPMGTRVLFRIEDSNNAHRMSFGAGGGRFDEITRFDKGVVSRELPTAPTAFVPGKWAKIDVRVRGQHFICKVDDRIAFEYDDANFPSGQIGLSTWNAPCRWRNILVKDPDGTVLWEGLPAIP